MHIKKSVKLLGAVFAFLIVMGSCMVTALAAPDTLGADVQSTVSDLLWVKSPELVVSSTNKRILPISAVAPEGTRITVYRYNYDTGMYHKAWANDSLLEAVVGPAGLFAGQVELWDGTNKFLVRAERWDGNYQVARFEVNVIDWSSPFGWG